MGCDIHCYIEHRQKDNTNRDWDTFGSRINPGRNYRMFEAMAGVRGEDKNAVCQRRGLPSDIGWGTRDDAFLLITKDGEGEGCTTLETATRYEKYGSKIENDAGGKPHRVSHPDWHSHSWLNAEELKLAIARCYESYCAWLDSAKRNLVESKVVEALAKDRIEELYGVPKSECFEPNYQAIVAVLETFERCGEDARLVFWFDN